MTQLRFMAGISFAAAGEWEQALRLSRDVLQEEPRFLEALCRRGSPSSFNRGCRL